MTYNIGDIVKNSKLDTCIVLATKTTPLTSDYLISLKGQILIKGIDDLATKQIKVPDGFDYIIEKIKSFQGKYCILDNTHNFEAVFGDDLIR